MNAARATGLKLMLLFACWLIASVSTRSGACFSAKSWGFQPCVLCWYQRIAMYPLVLILPVGMFPFDLNVVRYALPLSLLGTLIALFHLLLVAGYIPESIKALRPGRALQRSADRMVRLSDDSLAFRHCRFC